MDETDALINQPNAEAYTKLKITLDIFLFLLASWSEIGYSIFTGSSTSESILDPLKRYIYPLLSPDIANKITQSLNIVTQVLSYSDAMLTVATILDVKKKREKFIKEIRSGFNQLKYGEIKIIPFLLNLIIFIFSFVVISLSPWIGLEMRSYNINFSLAAGFTMFLGQMTVLILQYGSYIFATPKRIVDFFKLSKGEKITVFHNIFCTRKGIAVALRTLANTTVMGLRFHGMGLFSNKLLFGNNPTFGTFYSTVASISIVYRILMTQSLNDYKTRFTEENDAQRINAGNVQEDIVHENQGNTRNVFTKLMLLLLGILIILTFLLRTFSTPVLCTGPIDNPEQNYDTGTTLLATVGLLLGAFAAFQYCKFMWGLGKAVAKHISNLQCCRSTNSHRENTRNNNQGNLCDSQTEGNSYDSQTEGNSYDSQTEGKCLLSPVQPSV